MKRLGTVDEPSLSARVTFIQSASQPSVARALRIALFARS